MKRITFTVELHNEKINVSFDETGIENTINRFIGFLMAKGENETLIKNSIKNVMEGKWTSNLSSFVLNPSTVATTINTHSLQGIAPITMFDQSQLVPLENTQITSSLKSSI